MDDDHCPFCGQVLSRVGEGRRCQCGVYFFHATRTDMAFLLLSGLTLFWDGATWALL